MGAAPDAWAETLLGAIESAARTNPRIQAMDAQVLASRAGVRRSEAGLLPRISANADTGRRYDRYFYPADDPSYYKISPRGYGLDIQQTLFDGGKTLAAVRSSRHLVDSSRESARDMTQQVLYEAASAYLDVLRDDEILKLEKRFLGFLLAQKAMIVELYRFGDVTATDVAQVETRLAVARARVSLAEANFQGSRARYAQVIGDEPANLEPPLPVDRIVPASLEACVTLAASQNPALLAARALATSAREQVNVSRADFLPTVRVTGSLSDRRGGVDFYSYNRQTSASVVAQLNIPIFEGGGTVARVTETREIANRRELEADAELLRARAAVVASWHQYIAAKARQAAAEMQARAATAAFKGVREEFFIGQRTTSMVLDAVDELTNAGVALISAHRDRVLSSFAVARDIGALDESAVRNASAGGPRASKTLMVQLHALDIPTQLRLKREPMELRGNFDPPCIENCDATEITGGALARNRQRAKAPPPDWPLRVF
jgi:outer membrane protein